MILLLAALPLSGQSVLSIDGDVTFPIAINGHAVGWSFSRPHHHVSITAHLGNGGGHAYFEAYLMRAIGPGTTRDDEIAFVSSDLPYPHDEWVTLFDDVDLEAGTYWLIVAKPYERAHSSINWFVAEPKYLVEFCDVQYAGSQSYTFHSDAAEYIPASKFEKKYEPYGFQFEVTEIPTPENEGCPRQ